MTNVPTRRTSRHIHGSPRWLWIALAAVCLVGFGVTAAYVERPSARVGPNPDALATISLNGMATQVTNATYQFGSRTVPLQLKKDGLWPTVTLKPHTMGVVHATITGPSWLDWLPFNHQVLTSVVRTPANPALLAPLVTIPVGQAILVGLQSPAALMRIVGPVDSQIVKPSAPVAQFRIPAIRTPPDKNGQLVIETAARPWETLSRPQVLHWKTANWLTDTLQVGNSSPATRVLVTFSAPIEHASPGQWTFSPKVPGTWTRTSTNSFAFQASGTGWGPGSLVSLKIPGGTNGIRAANGSYLAKTILQQFTVANGSVLRLDQLLAELGYLPLNWTPTGSHLTTLAEQDSAIYSPPPGTFTWRYNDTPASLMALWQPDVYNVMVKGAVMHFERVNGLAVDGIAGPKVWTTLIADKLADKGNPNGYGYIHVSEVLPETLQLWYNGKIVLTSLCNTGIPQSPTYLGTSPVYLRYQSQTMSGINPFGVPYDDPGVPWVNYFAGGDAVHGFPRAAYGFPQSLGCVELPISNAAIAWNYIHYGTLVSVFPSS